MSYLLKIDVSPMGDNSSSLAMGTSFVNAFSAAHPGVEVKVRNLAANPLPHIDGEALTAGYVPEEGRTEGMKTKHQLRLDLIKEISDAKAVVITTPMWNWNIPSVLKAYIDHIVMPGVLDPYGNKKLAGKKVTILLAAGGNYGPDAGHPEWDYVTPYLKFIFTSIGSEDVQVIRADYQLAGIAPGMEALIPNKEKSIADGKLAAEARAAL